MTFMEELSRCGFARRHKRVPVTIGKVREDTQGLGEPFEYEFKE